MEKIAFITDKEKEEFYKIYCVSRISLIAQHNVYEAEYYRFGFYKIQYKGKKNDDIGYLKL